MRYHQVLTLQEGCFLTYQETRESQLSLGCVICSLCAFCFHRSFCGMKEHQTASSTSRHMYHQSWCKGRGNGQCPVTYLQKYYTSTGSHGGQEQWLSPSIRSLILDVGRKSRESCLLIRSLLFSSLSLFLLSLPWSTNVEKLPILVNL